MDNMEHAIERAAKVLADNWRNMHTNESLGKQRMLARALADAGLLTPAPLRDEWATYDPVPTMWGRTIWPAKNEIDAREKAHTFGYELRRRYVIHCETDWEEVQ